MSIRIPLAKIAPNPDQPRKDFTADHIAALAASIRKRGLIQPITVRPKGEGGRYEIVAGECRWRAHQLLAQRDKSFSEIACNVVAMDDRQRDIAALIENVQRADMNPIEEANGYKRLLDNGMSLDDVATEIGKPRERVVARLKLLTLAAPIQTLIKRGGLNVTQAGLLASVDARHHTKLVRQIGAGKLATTDTLRKAVNAIREADLQADAFADCDPPTKAELAALARLERKIDTVAGLVNAGFKDGECIAAKRIAPDRMKTAADKLALIQSHLKTMEQQLRTAAAPPQMAIASRAAHKAWETRRALQDNHEAVPEVA